MKKQFKGSLTVEAAMLQGILLFVIFLMLSVFWYCHNQIWFTEAACEAAAVGSMEASWNPEGVNQLVERKLKQIKDNQILPCGNLKLEQQIGKRSVTIFCQGEERAILGRWNGSFRIEQQSAVVRPAEYIRRIRAVGKWIE